MRSTPPTYPGLIDSGVEWIGQIPSSWQVKPLFTLVHENHARNRGLVEENVLSLSYGRIVRRDVSKNFGLLPESFETYQVLEPGFLVLRLTDLQNDKRSLRVGLAREKGIITSAYVGLGTRQGLDPSYAHYLLHSYDVTKVFYGLGGGVRQTMNFEDLKRLPVLVPSLEEQHGIVSFLDRETERIDKLIEKKQRLIELLEEKRTALISHAVTKGLDPNAPMKDSGVEWLGAVPEHWIIGPIKHLVESVTSGSRGWAEYYSDDGALFLQSGNLDRRLGIDLSSVQHVTPPRGAEGTRTAVCRDDVLVCITGALTGNVGIVDGEIPEAYVNQHVALMRPSCGSVSPRFLAMTLASSVCQAQFEILQYGGTKQGLGLEDVRNLLVAWPPVREQESIAGFFWNWKETARRSASVVESQVAKLREYRTALISAAVTGKIDVRNELEVEE